MNLNVRPLSAYFYAWLNAAGSWSAERASLWSGLAFLLFCLFGVVSLVAIRLLLRHDNSLPRLPDLMGAVFRGTRRGVSESLTRPSRQGNTQQWGPFGLGLRQGRGLRSSPITPPHSALAPSYS